MELFKRLEEETGQAVGFHTPGSLRLCTTPERVDEARYSMSRHRWQEAEQRLLEPEEVERLVPLMNMDGVGN